MNKRNLIKSAFAGSLMSIWVPPLITVVSLPAHASTSCNDITWQPGIGLEGWYALKAVGDHLLSFWDAMLWSVARENSVTELYSEEFQSGRALQDVTFLNPFESNLVT